MKSATRILISTFGAFSGLMGIEHGLGEVLQGSKAPGALVFPSWPGSAFFSILGGEPAMSMIPNLLVTGILAILVSLVYLAWVVFFIQRKHAGWVLILASILMLLVGGGIFPPVLGALIGAAATRIHAPLTWWRRHLPSGARQFLGLLWPWFFGACLLSWLGMFPGIPALSYFFGITNETLIFILMGGMFGFLILACIAGFARDARVPLKGEDSYRELRG